MKKDKLKIGIILGSTRKNRISPDVGRWVLEASSKNADADYELIDLLDYNLPLLGESEDKGGVERFSDKIASLDGFIFVLPEYNHGLPGALKNAIDWLSEEWHHKSAGIVSYGSAGGVRSAEHLRGVCAELHIADVRAHVVLSLFDDFKDMREFAPRKPHTKAVHELFNQVNDWAGALRNIR